MKGPRVLVVDDEPQIQRFLTVALTAAGYETLTAETGAQALRLAATAAPDLIVLDLGLPDRDGKEVLREMTALWADLDALERENKLDQLREPDFGFAFAAYRWAEGDDLDEVLDASGLAAGDFGRWVKQLLDLAGQVGDAAGDPVLRETAREAVSRLRRGVVSYSSVVD